jgi:hypothetical protein
VEIKLGQQLAHLFGLSLEQWQYAIDKPLVQISDAWPAYGNGPTGQGQPSRLAIAIATPWRCVNGFPSG